MSSRSLSSFPDFKDLYLYPVLFPFLTVCITISTQQPLRCSPKIINVFTLQLLFKAQLKPEEMKTTLPQVTRNCPAAAAALHRYGMAGV